MYKREQWVFCWKREGMPQNHDSGVLKASRGDHEEKQKIVTELRKWLEKHEDAVREKEKAAV